MVGRLSYRMKTRNQYFIILVLLLIALFGIAVFTFSSRSQGPEQVFTGTIDRDCAPWDGGAFTVQIPLNDGGTLSVSIWQSPEINSPSTFSFPDTTMQVGNASLLPQFGEPEQLTGQVWFQSVSQERPVEGRFSLTSERGEVLEGRFFATWGSQIVYCG